MSPAFAIALKDLRQLARDKAGLFFVAVFPIIYALFFGMIFSGGGGGETSKIGVVIADLDASDASKAFVQTLRDNTDLEVSVAPTREEAVARVRAGKAAACVVVPQGYADKGIFTGEPATIELGVDPSRKAEGGMLQGIVLQSAFERMQDLFTDPSQMGAQIDKALANMSRSQDMSPGVRDALTPFLDSAKRLSRDLDTESKTNPEARDSARAGFQPVEIQALTIERSRRDGPENSFAITFPQAAIWGIMGATAGFGISLVSERTRGTMVRLRAAPMRRGSVLLGKAIACFVTVQGVIVLLLLFARLVFGLRVGEPALLALAALCIGVCFVGLMMALASIARTEQAAGGIGWAVMTVLAMLGGGMIPLMFMPSWMSSLSSVSPMKWAIVAMEGAVWRGFTLAQMALPCAVLLAIGAVGMLLGVRATGRSDA